MPKPAPHFGDRYRALLLLLGACWPAFALASPTPAADDRAFALSWVRLAGAESCPARPRLAAEVAARLGRSPFSPDAEQALEVVVGREQGHWLVRIHARAGDGTILGSRVLQSDGEDCSAVFSATVLALALTVDPEAVQRFPAPVAPTPASGEREPAAAGAPTAQPWASPAVPPAPLEPAAPAAMSLAEQRETALPPPPLIASDAPQVWLPSARASSLNVAMQVGPALALGLLPQPAPGIIVRGQATTEDSWGFDLGALLLPARRTGPDHDTADIGVGLSAGFLGASFSPLRDKVSLSFALGGHAGAQHVAVYSPTPLEEGPGNYFWAALRAGGSLGLLLAPPIGIGLGAEAVVPLTRHSYSVLGEADPAFESGPLAFLSYLTLNVASD